MKASDQLDTTNASPCRTPTNDVRDDDYDDDDDDDNGDGDDDDGGDGIQNKIDIREVNWVANSWQFFRKRATPKLMTMMTMIGDNDDVDGDDGDGNDDVDSDDGDGNDD